MGEEAAAWARLPRKFPYARRLGALASGTRRRPLQRIRHRRSLIGNAGTRRCLCATGPISRPCWAKSQTCRRCLATNCPKVTSRLAPNPASDGCASWHFDVGDLLGPVFRGSRESADRQWRRIELIDFNGETLLAVNGEPKGNDDIFINWQ